MHRRWRVRPLPRRPPNPSRVREGRPRRPPRAGRRRRRTHHCEHLAAAGENRTPLGHARRGRATRRSGPPPPQAPPRPHPADALLAQLAYVVVNEAGASVYSTSQVGREELPDSDATLRSGISIGRRLQDPLSELVKIEPQNIGVGLYQHDINPKHLKETLENGDFELREFCRRRPEHGQRSALAARLGPQPVDGPANCRLSQGARSIHRSRAVAAG